MSQVKYLGVILDESLDYSIHAALTAARVKKSTGFVVRTCRRVMSRKSLCHLFSALLRVLLLYAVEVVYPINTSDRIKLERCQKYALRLILGCFSHDVSYGSLCSRTGFAAIYHTVFTKRLYLIHAYVYGFRHFPSGVIVLLNNSNRRSSNRSNHSCAIFIPKCSISRFSNSAFVVSCVAYNCLPSDTVLLSSSRFKSQIALQSTFEFILHKIANFNSKIVTIIGI